MQIGLLLPHFGEHANAELILRGSRAAEQLGLDSVWVRDHLLFEPHGELEKPNAVFYDALTVLSVVGASTSRLTLGTGALIPFRHPIHAGLLATTMTQFFGPRLILGIGSGNSDREFEAVGLGGVPRPELVLTNMQIMRGLWSGGSVDWHDGVFDFDDVCMQPEPLGGQIPLWYCGNTPLSARMAAQSCDGWMPGRISLETLRLRVRTIEEAAFKLGRPRPAIGMIPSASIAPTREKALARVNVEGLLRWANNARFWVKPPSGRFTEVDDLRGLLIYGSPDDVVEQLDVLAAAGVDHVAFDFRSSFDEWEEQIHMLGEQVLPRLAPATSSVAAGAR